jgi:dihydrofolate synthase/folylpolyglutamate synthase
MSRFDSLEAWLHWQENLHPRTIDLTLERVASVFARLNGQRKKPLTITVAGTNGKGSTVAFLEAIYKAQGYKVGTYTSPHVLRYNERIKINGLAVSDEVICQACDRIDTARNETSLTYFEFGTLTALDIFARAELDIQLLEVGLGGRLDAVNIIDTDAAIITSIDLDHIHWLGETREAIGTEKAGIFRTGVPAIIGDLQPPQSLLERAAQVQARLFCLNQHFGYQRFAENWTWFSDKQRYEQLPLPALKGEHQFRNASAVILAIHQLQQQLPVTEQAIRQGLETVQLMGRFQLIAGDIPVLLDVAHNPPAVQTLVAHLDEYFAGKKIQAVFAMMKDKDIQAVIALLKDKIDHWFIAPSAYPRMATAEVLQNHFQQQGIERVVAGFENFSQAFAAAKAQAKAGELILVFGSFLVVSDCLTEFKTI